MNVLFISSRKKWNWVVDWMISVSQLMEQRGHRCFMMTADTSELIQNPTEPLDLYPIHFGMDYNPITILRIMHFIRNHHIHAVVLNTKKELLTAGIASHLCGTPLIRMISNTNNFTKTRRLQHWVAMNLFPHKTLAYAAQKEHSWVKAIPQRVLYIGRSSAEIGAASQMLERKRIGCTESDFIIGVNCKTVRQECLEMVIRAFSRMKHQQPVIKLVINGVGPDKQGLIDQTYELRIQKRVLFGGINPDNYHSASIFHIALQPSEYEVFPGTILEYFAVKAPVVAIDSGEVREIIKDGQNGFLFAPGDVHTLTDLLDKLYEDGALRATIALEGWNTLQAKFSETIMGEEFENVLSRCRT